MIVLKKKINHGEEAQGKYDGKKDIIEYKRNGNLILPWNILFHSLPSK